MNIFSLRSDTHRVTIHKLFIFNEYKKIDKYQSYN